MHLQKLFTLCPTFGVHFKKAIDFIKSMKTKKQYQSYLSNFMGLYVVMFYNSWDDRINNSTVESFKSEVGTRCLSYMQSVLKLI